MGTSKMETALRQEQITQAALNIVSTSGLKGLSIAAIADRIGLVPSAIYRHYKGKEEVLDAVIDLIGNRLLSNVEAICQETGDPVERLKRLLLRHIGMIKENQGIPRIIFSEDAYDNRPERREKVFGNVKKYLVKVSEIIRQGQEEGKIRTDTDPWSLAVMFLGLIQPSGILWHLSGGEFDVDRQARKSWDLFYDCLQPIPHISPDMNEKNK